MTARRRTFPTVLVLAAAATAAILTTGVGLAETSGSSHRQDACSSRGTSAPLGCPLLEFATPDRTGSFYTIDSAEAASASRLGFLPKSDADGIRLFPRQEPGMIPLERLRLRQGHVPYLVTADPAREDRPSRFVNEGTMAYVYSAERPGTMKLCRYSKNEDWRVSRDGRGDLAAVGFDNECDGVNPDGSADRNEAPLGWVPKG